MTASETRPLSGLAILVLRSGEAGRSLAERIAGLGGDPVELPVTEVVGLPAGEPAARARDRLLAGDIDWVVFASAHAVAHFFRVLDALGTDRGALAQARVAAVGAQTAAALRKAGARVDLVPSRSDAVGLAEAVAEAAASPSARVLVPRSAGGRPELIEGLQAKLAEVIALDVYESRFRDVGDAALAPGLERLRSGHIDVALFFSPSQVESVASLLGDAAPEVLGAVDVRAAIGRTTAAALRAHGIDANLVASAPSAEQLLSEVAQRFQDRRGCD